jgi:hypothetical protein
MMGNGLSSGAADAGNGNEARSRTGAPGKPRLMRWRLPRFTDRLTLGSRGLKVSPFCLGMVGEPATIQAAYDAGINFFFVTTDMHWPLYEATRRGLADLLTRDPGARDKIVVAGVCYPTQPQFCTAPFAELVNAVPELGRLDVLLAGGAYQAEFANRLPVLVDHRRRRFLGSRAIGAAFHDRSAARQAIDGGLVDIAGLRYNADHAGARLDLFPRIGDRPHPLLFGLQSASSWVSPARMTELGLPAPGYWQPTVTDHHRFSLTAPQMDGLVVTLQTPRDVSALEADLEKGPLDEQEEKYLLDVAGLTRATGNRVAAEG